MASRGRHDENNGDEQGAPAAIAREDTVALRPRTAPLPVVREGTYQGVAVEPGETMPDFRVYRTLEVIYGLIKAGRPDMTYQDASERAAVALLTNGSGKGTPLRCEVCGRIYFILTDQEPFWPLVGKRDGICGRQDESGRFICAPPPILPVSGTSQTRTTTYGPEEGDG